MADPLAPPPSQSVPARVAEVAIASTGAIPLAGAPVAAALDQLVGPLLERRRERWLRTLHEAVVQLQERDVDLDSELFVSAVSDASRVALGEHLEAKLELLKAVVMNTVLKPSSPTSDLWALRYIRWIDELEPEHVVLLRFASDPRAWLVEHGVQPQEYMMGGQRQILDDAKLPYSPDLLELLLDDLARLALGAMSQGTVSASSMYAPWISARGQRFLEWLTIV